VFDLPVVHVSRHDGYDAAFLAREAALEALATTCGGVFVGT
jgi:hypothetical protein